MISANGAVPMSNSPLVDALVVSRQASMPATAHRSPPRRALNAAASPERIWIALAGLRSGSYHPAP